MSNLKIKNFHIFKFWNLSNCENLQISKLETVLTSFLKLNAKEI